MYHIHNMSILQLLDVTDYRQFFFSTFIFIQSNQTTSSSAMEFMGHQQALTFLLANTAMNITIYITDRHSQITKWMRTECPALCKQYGKQVITHFFDRWHVAKK